LFRVFCTRNYGISALKLASLPQFQRLKGQLQVTYYFKEAIQALIEGYSNGKRCHMPSDWIERSSDDLYNVIKELNNYSICRSEGRGERCGFLEGFRQVATLHPRVLTHLYLCLTEECLKDIVTSDEDSNQTTTTFIEMDWRKAKHSLGDLSVYLDFVEPTWPTSGMMISTEKNLKVQSMIWQTPFKSILFALMQLS
jgi:hypothetical protein